MNMKFGLLTILKEVKPKISKSGRKYKRLLCICDCGVQTIVYDNNLRYGYTKSCGCLRGENHGLRETPEYRTWKAMRRRCFSPSDKKFKSYGGRGISICKEWDSFPQFLSDMGTRPSKQHSIDRINNDGNYSPSNCRWAITTQQNRNRRTTIRLFYNGKKLTLQEISEITGIGYATLKWRYKNNWPTEDIVSTSPNKGNRIGQ